MLPGNVNIKNIQKILDKHLGVERNILSFLISLEESENDMILDKKEIRDLINQMRELSKETNNLFNKKHSAKDKWEKEESTGQIKITIERNNQIPQYLIESFEKARDSIISFYKNNKDDNNKDNKDNNIKVLDIYPQLSFIDKFSKYRDGSSIYEEENNKIDPIPCIVYNSSNKNVFSSENYNMKFSSGNKIILNKNMCNINVLSIDESMELLRFLEVVIKDEKYDYIRRKLIEHIQQSLGEQKL